jgi:zinc/manganese transport system substrate-binding protein
MIGTEEGGMKKSAHLSMLVVIVALATLSIQPARARARERRLRVVTTLTDYAWAARVIGGDHVRVRAISQGDQDAHFVRPKPSFAVWMAEADLFITTGLDLELWVPSLLDKAGNARIREGQVGYVAAAAGLVLDDVPAVMDRSQGGVHIYGNPHVHTSPVNMRQIARNIAVGLKKVDPGRAERYDANLRALVQALDERLFGAALVRLLGGDTLAKLAASGNLWSFLEGRAYEGRPMTALAGGWLDRARALRGRTIVTYHRNWGYFARLFGIHVLGQIEPKPAIPPSPRDVERLIRMMRDHRVKIVLAANYFDEDKARMITGEVGGRPVIVPLHTRGAPGVDDYPALVDMWIDRLIEAASSAD